MILTLLKDDGKHTIIGTDDRKLTYDVETSSKVFGASASTVTRVDSNKAGDAQSVVIAKIGWRTWGPSMDYEGRKIPLEKFLPKARSFSSSNSRVLRASNGQTYKWKTGPDFAPVLELYNSSKQLIAKLHPSKSRITKDHLEVTDESLRDITDELVISFLIMRQWQLDRTGVGSHGMD